MVRINQTKNNPNFNGIYNNKILLSSLENIAEHSASFCAGASFVGACVVRPLAISLTPQAQKENKKILSSESISSGLVKLLVALGVSIPIENAIKNINKKDIIKKDNFDFLSQVIKLSSNLISSIPKSIISVALIPIIYDSLSFFNKNKNKQKKETESKINNISFSEYQKNLSFKGKKTTNFITSVINSNPAQEFANKYGKNKDNIARNMTVLTDMVLSLTSVIATKMSKKINEKDKKPLIINKTLSTLISIAAGCTIDKIVQSLGKNFVEKFKKENISNLKLEKYIEGINILRPTLIFALIYYAIIPIITTYACDKISNSPTSKKNNLAAL